MSKHTANDQLPCLPSVGELSSSSFRFPTSCELVRLQHLPVVLIGVNRNYLAEVLARVTDRCQA